MSATRVLGLRPRALIAALVVGTAPQPAPVAAQEGDTVVVTLPEAESRALMASPLLSGPRATVRLSEVRVEQARRARYLPEFNLRNVWGPIPRQRGEFTETGGVRLRPWMVRWATPDQLDAMAAAAGFSVESRWAAMGGESFTEDSAQHVTVYRLTG